MLRNQGFIQNPEINKVYSIFYQRLRAIMQIGETIILKEHESHIHMVQIQGELLFERSYLSSIPGSLYRKV